MKQKKKLFVILAILVMAIAFVIVAIVALSKGGKKDVQSNLDLGQNYLDELKYEQALASYMAVLEIDPNNVEAYLGMAEAYAGMGDMNSAISILENGYEITGDSELLDKLNELYALQNAGDIPSGDGGNVSDAMSTMSDEELRAQLDYIDNYLKESEFIAWCSMDNFAVHLPKETRDAILAEFIPVLEEGLARGAGDDYLLYDCLTDIYLAMGNTEKCLEVRQEAYQKMDSELFMPEERTLENGNKIDAYGRYLFASYYGYDCSYEYSEISGPDPIRTVYIKSDGTDETIIEYDSLGRPSAYIDYNQNGSRNMKSNFVYEGNTVTIKTEYFGTDTAWAESCNEDNDYFVETFDELGRVVSSVYYHDGEMYSEQNWVYKEDGSREDVFTE